MKTTESAIESTKNPAAVALGSIKSDRKAVSSAANGHKGGRPSFEWLVITTGRSLDTYTIWAKKKTEAAAIKLLATLGRNAMEGHTLVINIADRAKYGV